MAASITIASSALSPSTKTILCQGVSVGHKRELISPPNANGTDIVSVQTQSYPNPIYTLRNIEFTGGSGVLTYDDCVTLTKLNYDGTNAPVLTITYGKSGSTSVLANNAGSTSGISVVVDSFNTNINASDSIGGYLPVGTLTLRETA